MRTTLLVAVVMAAAAGAQAQGRPQEDPRVCAPYQAPVVLEQRADRLVVAHVELAAPMPTSCDAFLVTSWSWTVQRCDESGLCEAFPFSNVATSCGNPRRPGEKCPDPGRIRFRPQGPGLYTILLEVGAQGGGSFTGTALVRRGPRPERAR